MKQRVINGNSLEFFNDDNSKKGEIKISGSDVIINPIDSSGTVIFGEEGTINDIEVGATGTPVDFTFLGGGTITPNGNTLTLGESGDTVDLSNATIGTITASIFQGGSFIGDGSGLSNTPSTFTNITASGDISASLTGSFAKILLGGATSFSSAATQLQANGTIDAGNTGTFRAQRGKFNIINNRINGQDIIEFDSGQNISFISGSETVIRIASGSVGIGTSSPSAKLHLSGSNGDTADSALRQSRAGVKIWDQAIDSSGRLQWGYRAAGSEGGTITVTFTLDDDNNKVALGSGHAPTAKLHISGTTTTDRDWETIA